MLKNFIKKFISKKYMPELYKEAFRAYVERLPDEIEVQWFRDDDFIVGKIQADGFEFMTQAKSAKEFIEMVNDSLLAVYETPEEYIDVVFTHKMFVPNEKQFNELNDASIEKSNFGIVKKKLALV